MLRSAPDICASEISDCCRGNIDLVGNIWLLQSCEEDTSCQKSGRRRPNAGVQHLGHARNEAEQHWLCRSSVPVRTIPSTVLLSCSRQLLSGVSPAMPLSLLPAGCCLDRADDVVGVLYSHGHVIRTSAAVMAACSNERLRGRADKCPPTVEGFTTAAVAAVKFRHRKRQHWRRPVIR